jgi:hypothetical protein
MHWHLLNETPQSSRNKKRKYQMNRTVEWWCESFKTIIDQGGKDDIVSYAVVDGRLLALIIVKTSETIVIPLSKQVKVLMEN